MSGVELSDEMAAVARARVTGAGWDNVDIIVGKAATAPLPTHVDGALLFLTHDLVRSPLVLDRAIRACRPGARVVAFGPKTPPSRNWPLAVAIRQLTNWYVTTFEGSTGPGATSKLASTTSRSKPSPSAPSTSLRGRLEMDVPTTVCRKMAEERATHR